MRKVVLWLDSAEERKHQVGIDEVNAHVDGQNGAQEDGEEREREVAAAEDAVVGCEYSSHLRRLVVGGEPCGVVRRREDFEVSGHAVVSESAELGAEDRVGPRSGRREVDVDVLARDCILLNAEGGDGEAVDDVLRVEAEVDLAIGGQDELRGDEVVRATRVGGIDTQGIAFAGRDEFGTSAAEVGVSAGITEGPGELQAGRLHLQRGEIGTCVAGGCPEALGTDREEGEHQGEGG